MSERYVVELDLKRVGDLGIGALDGKIRGTEKRVDILKRGFGDLSRSVAPLSSALDTVASKTASFARNVGVAGGVALFAGATYGVVNLNNEIEKATIGLGVIFNASGVASSVPVGIEKAKNAVAQMRKDAQRLPGEFSELQNIFTTAATPAFRSGATIKSLQDLSAKAMVAGKVTNMDMGQVAREFTLLLEGRAGSHNTFGGKMGLTGELSKKFNALAPEKRFAELSKLLGKYEGGLSAFENSYDAQSSTLIDNLKSFGLTATSSLFLHVKDTMKEANDWFTSHQAEAQSFAARWGAGLVNVFEKGKRALLEWGPIVYNFAEGAYDRFTEIWVDAQPYVEKFGNIVKKALEDPNGTIDKLIELAKLWAGMKIGGSLVSGLASGGLKGGMMSGGAALAMYGVGNAALNGGSSESYVETTAGGAIAGFGMGGPLGAAIGGLTGAIVSLTQTYQHAAEAETDFRSRMASEAEAWNTDMRRFYASHGFTAAEAERSMREHGLAVQNTIMEIDKSAGAVAGSIYNVAANIESASYALLNRVEKRDNDISDYWGGMLRLGAQNNQANREFAGAATSANADKHKHKGGGGGSIQKVEIVVTSNQHPSRIARAVVGEIGKLQRMSGQSPHAENYSALDEVF